MSVDKKYCFSENEFMLMAGSLGIRKMYGFTPKNPFSADEKEVTNTIFSLLKKGFIHAESDGEKYVTDDKVRQIFDAIRMCRRIITFTSTEEMFTKKCLFCGDKTALLEAGDDVVTYVKGCCDSNQELLSWIIEDGFSMPGIEGGEMESDFREPQDSDVSNLCDLAVQTWQLEEKKLHEELRGKGLKAAAEIIGSQSYERIGRILLFEGMVDDLVVLQNDETVKVCIYSKQPLKELILNMMEG